MSFILPRRSAVALCAAVIFSSAAAAAPASVDLVFYAPHFSKLENGSVITYKFVRKAEDPKLDPSFEDVVSVKVGPSGAEDSVTVDLFSGARAINLPNMSKSGNPVIVAVLEQDVKEMNKSLGGSPFYFRNRLRQAIAADTPAEPTKVDFGGKTVDGWKVTVKPFQNDEANKGKLGQYAERSYELIFCDAVPGGLYALKTVTPKADGAPLLTEELTVASESKAEATK
ncbi:hypothetical protein IHQ68_07695 [Chelatococcus sambhunathii]|uniref:Uncharacterized protein n=1 Tax=Chelatococcus sambhunathii TaxID=363953 RepID=A0ABU1DEJ2_9HYPH|nr:hypothetical protein [Chelatococcus sambhunathii]MDR4306497.1 hypothetical protein [Chelatococcus sambhunathii]